MATISPISSVSVKPAFRADNDSKTQDIARAVEENSKTTKLCAGAALAASVATLVPLSILAVRTGKISKIADDVQGITSAARKTAESACELGQAVVNRGKTVLEGISEEQLARGKEFVSKGFDDIIDAGSAICSRVREEFVREFERGAEAAVDVAEDAAARAV